MGKIVQDERRAEGSRLTLPTDTHAANPSASTGFFEVLLSFWPMVVASNHASGAEDDPVTGSGSVFPNY